MPVPDTLITTYLEITDAADFSPSFSDDKWVALLTMQPVDLDYYRFLYQSVGSRWRWRERQGLSDKALSALLQVPEVSVDVLYARGAPAGFVELKRGGPSTEIAYFGLREPFFGRGLGKHLLSVGIQKALDNGAARVWVHTCNLDSPRALKNYEARGFKVYDVRETPMPTEYS